MGKGIERFNAILAEQVAALRAEVEEIDATMERLRAERNAVLGLMAEVEKFQGRSQVAAPWRHILDVLGEGRTYCVPEIAILTGRTRGAIHMAIGDEIKRGTVRRIGYGQYQKVETREVANADAPQENSNA